jgi:hypothetical protein
VRDPATTIAETRLVQAQQGPFNEQFATEDHPVTCRDAVWYTVGPGNIARPASGSSMIFLRPAEREPLERSPDPDPPGLPTLVAGERGARPELRALHKRDRVARPFRVSAPVI